MNKILLIAILLACSSSKTKNSLAEEKKELAKAQKELSIKQVFIQQLEESIAQKEIERIQKELALVNKQTVRQSNLTHEQWLSFFYEQREILDQIIRTTPHYRVEAQQVLDEILTLITELSDSLID